MDWQVVFQMTYCKVNLLACVSVLSAAEDFAFRAGCQQGALWKTAPQHPRELQEVNDGKYRDFH